MLLQEIDYKFIIALYGAALSTFVFFRSVWKRVRYVYKFDSLSSAERLKLTIFSRSSREVFVHKIVLTANGDGAEKSIEIREFVKPFEVRSWSFAENVIDMKRLDGIVVFTSGKPIKASAN